MSTTAEPVPRHGALEAPTTFWGIMARLGPGLILVGNIVGSGELIATPALAAQAGFFFLWLILFSCIIKVFFQVEIGRYALSEGRTTLESFNALPGPRWRVHWMLWYWILMLIASQVQVGGMCGGVAQAMQLAFPLPDMVHREKCWAVLTGISVAVLLAVGRYAVVERISILLVSIFTLVTIYSLVQLQFTPIAVTPAQVVDGFSFSMPPGVDPMSLIVLAMMAFGITGVGASELVGYPYWCLEKGYARFVGVRDGSEDWARRARGWIRVMQYDAWLSMLLFTIATIAFYLLGAALLHPEFLATGQKPEGVAMVERLSGMYAASFGVYSRYIFLLGALCVLYSTFFIATAANSRMVADWLALCGFYDPKNTETRRFIIAVLCQCFTIFSTVAYLFFQEPVAMVKVSGIMQALMLPMIGWAVMVFAYRWTDRRIRGPAWWYAMLWVALVLISATSFYGAYAGVSQLLSLASSSVRH